MRIAHFLDGRCNPDSANGVDKVVYHLTKEFAASGQPVLLIQITSRAAVPIPGVQISSFREPRLPFVLPPGLLETLERFHPDFVHLHSVYTPRNYTLARWLWRKKIRYALTPHGGLTPLSVEHRRPLRKLVYTYILERWILAHAAFIQSVGEAVALETARLKVSTPVIVVPNAVDHAVLSQPVDHGALDRAIPAVKGRKVFMFLGRLEWRQKGLDLLIQAFSKAKLNDCVLVLAGPGSDCQKSSLVEIARRCGIASSVVLCGPLYAREKYDCLASAWAFVHPSRWEGMPVSVLEAASVGLPCLLTPAADPSGVFERKGAAVVVPPDEFQLAEALRDLAQRSAADRQSLGIKARQVAARFTWPGVASQVLAAYECYGS